MIVLSIIALAQIQSSPLQAQYFPGRWLRWMLLACEGSIHDPTDQLIAKRRFFSLQAGQIAGYGVRMGR